MKSKKAVTLLTRVESLLSDVLDEYSVIEKQVEKNVRAGLLSAKESVKSAMKFISALPDAQISYKSGRPHAKAKTRAKTSVRAKKTSAARKRR
jgi:division protein CdvB (Snf7/Vps24/ESCRT-III family)